MLKLEMIIFVYNFLSNFFSEYPFYLLGPVVHLITLQIEILKYLESILTREQQIGKAITFNKVNDVARVW